MQKKIGCGGSVPLTARRSDPTGAGGGGVRSRPEQPRYPTPHRIPAHLGDSAAHSVAVVAVIAQVDPELT